MTEAMSTKAIGPWLSSLPIFLRVLMMTISNEKERNDGDKWPCDYNYCPAVTILSVPYVDSKECGVT